MNCFQKLPIELCCLQSAYLLDEVMKSYGLISNSPHLHRLLKEDVSLEKLLVRVILSRDGLALQAYADAFTVVACIGRPSLRSFRRHNHMNEREVLHCIYELLKDLCLFFDRPAPKKIKELIWQIYKDYMDFSLEDMVKFFDCCKKKRFATPFQHISSKGITTDFLLDWIGKYQKNRVESYQVFTRNHQEVGQAVFIEYHPMPALVESDAKRCQLQFSKLSIKHKQLWPYLIYQLIYQPDFWDLNQEELFKKTQVHLDNLDIDYGNEENVQTLKLRFSANPTSKLLKRKIDKLILSERIQTGEELCCRLLPDLLVRGCYLFSKETAVKEIINYKLKALKRSYITYVQHQLSNGDVPMEEAFYIKLEAWKWICKMNSTQPI